MKGGENIESQIKSAIADFTDGGAIAKARGIMTIKNIVTELPGELSTCESIKGDVAALEAWASVFSSKAKISAAIAKNMALHHKKIEADIANVKTDYDNQAFFKLGEDAAQLLGDAIGPAEKPSKNLEETEVGMPIQAPVLFAYGFLGEFIKVNNLVEFTACAAGFENDFDDVETAIKDLQGGDKEGAIEALTKWVATLSPDF